MTTFIRGKCYKALQLPQLMFKELQVQHFLTVIPSKQVGTQIEASEASLTDVNVLVVRMEG